MIHYYIVIKKIPGIRVFHVLWGVCITLLCQLLCSCMCVTVSSFLAFEEGKMYHSVLECETTKQPCVVRRLALHCVLLFST